MSYADCKPGDPCWDLGYIFNDVLPPNTISGMEELYGCGINPYSFIDCNILTGCTSVLSGLTGPYITGATYDSTTGCLTFYRQSGATFSACGFLTGATSTSSSSGYWSAGTRGIVYTGGSTNYVGIGTEDPNKTLTVKGSVSATTTLDVGGNTNIKQQLNISGNTTSSGNISLTQDSYLYFGYDVNNQTYIREDSNNLVIDANDDILLRPDDDVKIAYGTTQYSVFDGSKASLMVGSTSVPTSRITIDGVQTGSVSAIAEANDPTTAIALANFFNTKSDTVDNANLYIGEKRAEGTGDFFIYPQGPDAEILINCDLVLGAYKSGTLYSNELLRLKGSTARVGIKNVSPAFDLDVGGSSNANTIYSAGTDLYGLIKIIGEGVVAVGRWSGGTQGIIYTGGSSTFVGIGTTNPNQSLTVGGTISATTSILVGSDCIIKSPEVGSVYIGDDAGANWSSGSISNTAVGRLAMGTGTMSTAVQNTAFGFAAFAGVTTGDYNTAVGLQSLSTSDTGSWNTSVGKTASYGTTYHSYNVAIGANALYFTTSGSLGKSVTTNTHNTAVGYSSQYYSLDGIYNTSVGSQTLGNGGVTYAGTGNTAMGFEAMKNSQTGRYNLALGYQAGDNITTGDYNISIGPNADPPSATADYQMNIANIIYGNDEYTDSAVSQIGIGYTDPKVKLDVHHNPTNLANNTGGGESITFGIESNANSLSAGTLMWLHTDGYWYNADADNVVSGATNLIAIALGTAVSDGMLIRGFYDYSSNLQGTFAKGMPCYVSENAGFVDFTAPSGSADYVRILGYGTDTANVIYFNPDKTWVELS